MPLWGMILTAVLGSTGLSAVIVAALQHHWQKQEKEDTRIDALVAAQTVIMIDRVRYLGKCYIKDGEIKLSDKETLHEMYRTYKSLGGNGHLETVMEEVDNLEVKG